MKTRIIKRSSNFIPQFRAFFLWWYYLPCDGTPCYEGFKHIDDARRFLKEKTEKSKDVFIEDGPA